ncbi:bifunctional proline dehydrogenase/L-glutamate gamma-semialdehyde dehydrogenase PutA [Andreprevotia chitinilytica]|uniref:bifunctional proline dehydrogenase/L-glutamate gamma-semialdehyde dehydrogenase PutA n=1 Tax=Andreprevotia chitinilytica TaxID=396808 RepID=UPI0005588568|nr:bifunctional proline dehydrogenase/L-glutamate gamma-semialdehyde dehydrogenase PutA [Andreprevotia chitinilytica]
MVAEPQPDRAHVAQAHFADEAQLIRQLLPLARLNEAEQAAVDATAPIICSRLRTERRNGIGADALLAAFPLASPAGRALLTLAEALLRIPDLATADRLIRDQLHAAAWDSQPGTTTVIRVIQWALRHARNWSEHDSIEPLVRFAIKAVLQELAQQFVIAEDLIHALRRREAPFLYSFDMLGEAALNRQDAAAYHAAYRHALEHLSYQAFGEGARHPLGISVKLSALSPRYEPRQGAQIIKTMYPALRGLALMAARHRLPLTIDAEESERLDLALDLFGYLLNDPQLVGWDGLGIAVQAYQKRAVAQVDWLIDAARAADRQITVRLVKGAYWDSEIKHAQQEGWPDYAVFTRKEHTDVSYLACARRLFSAPDAIYPQFATHNPYTALAVNAMAGSSEFEFQSLFGMGETLYRLLHEQGIRRPCRLYAPVGNQATLLPYLVRRLLENGANSAFVHQLIVADQPDVATVDPVAAAAANLPPPSTGDPALTLAKPTQRDADHIQADGLCWGEPAAVAALIIDIESARRALLRATSLPKPNGMQEPIAVPSRPAQTAHAPADLLRVLGTVQVANTAEIEHALTTAHAYAPHWAATQLVKRAACLERTADLLQQRQADLLALLIDEAGKTLPNALSELREAIDACRYYARTALAAWPSHPPAPLGMVIAISPWNFPLAIFLGQIAAALIAGNVVLAKPSEHTPLIAWRAVQLLYDAGVPPEALQLLLGDGQTGALLTGDARVAGVLFTGSLPTAQAIHRALAHSDTEGNEERVLVAETGGVNALIADSSALTEQLIQNVLIAAFDSAGQRCSALRLLCVPTATAPVVLNGLKAAMNELQAGDPRLLDTDIGPLISQTALGKVETAILNFRNAGLTVTQGELPEPCWSAHFVPPTLVELDRIDQLPGEIFGPVLCVLPYSPERLEALLQEIDQLGYGLALGIESRCPSFIAQIQAGLYAGNVYVNRPQIGAVIGCQPFGGARLSGTGPKAGGPWLIWRLVRQADPCQAGPATPKVSTTAKRLRALAERFEPDLCVLIDNITSRSPVGLSHHLPGPTGEQNTLHYQPCGIVACVARDRQALLVQLITALLTGNRALIPGHIEPPEWVANFPDDLPVVADPLHEEYDVVLCDCYSAALERQLSESNGPVIQAVIPDQSGRYPLFRLVREVCVSINTAAAGGNAALLGGQLTDGG